MGVGEDGGHISDPCGPCAVLDNNALLIGFGRHILELRLRLTHAHVHTHTHAHTHTPASLSAGFTAAAAAEPLLPAPRVRLVGVAVSMATAGAERRPERVPVLLAVVRAVVAGPELLLSLCK